MAIRFSCESCGAKFSAKEESADRGPGGRGFQPADSVFCHRGHSFFGCRHASRRGRIRPERPGGPVPRGCGAVGRVQRARAAHEKARPRRGHDPIR